MGKRSGFEVRFATDPEEFADFNSGALVRTFGARAASCGENVAETLSNAAFQPRESGTSSLAAASGLGGRPQWRWKMDELSFKPAGAAFVAVVAALAPGQAGHAAPDQVPGQALGQTAVKAHAAARARETAARDAIVEAAAQLGPAAPFDELSTGTVLHRADPAKGQLGLPFEE